MPVYLMLPPNLGELHAPGRAVLSTQARDIPYAVWRILQQTCTEQFYLGNLTLMSSQYLKLSVKALSKLICSRQHSSI